VKHAVEVETRLYDKLFLPENPEAVEEGEDFRSNLNPDSLKITTSFTEPFISNMKPLDKVQFERVGYFCVDADSVPNRLVLNKTVGLKGAWQKPA
jgi:glutaminyl-tRNA synthetase